MNAVNPGDPNAPRFNAGSGFTLLPVISSPHFPIISDAWSATYYVDATNGNDSNNGLSPEIPWQTIAKVNSSRFNPGDQILSVRKEMLRENGNPSPIFKVLRKCPMSSPDPKY
jgi:hypothetical protein